MATGSASVSNCLTKSVKYELLFIPRVYGLPFDHFRCYRVCLILFPVYEKKQKNNKNYIILQVKLSICDNDCYNDRGWTQLFKEGVKIVKIIFL